VGTRRASSPRPSPPEEVCVNEANPTKSVLESANIVFELGSLSPGIDAVPARQIYCVAWELKPWKEL